MKQQDSYVGLRNSKSEMEDIFGLRAEEAKHVGRITTELRSAIVKLQRKFHVEKEELLYALKTTEDSLAQETADHHKLIKKYKHQHEKLTNQLHAAEKASSEQANELSRHQLQLSQANNRITELSQSNYDLTSELAKAKSAYQKACSRAETAVNQVGDLRKRIDQISLKQSSLEEAARLANERRIGSESALNAVRQRADKHSQRVIELEREMAVERTRNETKHAEYEKECQKLNRRLVGAQSEATKWKQSSQTKCDEQSDQLDQLTKNLATTNEERDKLRSELEQSRETERKQLLEIDKLQHQAALLASDASSRLMVALTTGEETVSTALELKRCIEQKLQPELSVTQSVLKSVQLECKEWRKKYEANKMDLERVRTKYGELKQHGAQDRSTLEANVKTLEDKLKTLEADFRSKVESLAASNDHITRLQTQLANCKDTFPLDHTACEQRVSSLTDQLNKVKTNHTQLTERLRTSQRLVNRLRLARDTALTGMSRLEAELKGIRQSTESDCQAELEKARSELQNSEKELKARNIQLQTLRDQSSRELMTKTQNFEQLIDTLKHQLTTERDTIQQCRSEIQHLRDKCSCALADQNSVDQHLRSVVSNQSIELEHIKAELASQTGQLELKSKELQFLQDTSSKSKDLLHSSQARIDELLMEKDTLQRCLKQSTKALDMKTEEYLALHAHVQEITFKLQASTNLNTATGQEKAGLVKHLHVVEQELAQSTTRLQQTETCLSETEASEQTLKGELSKMTAKCDEIEKNLQTLLDQSEHTRAMLQSEISSLQMKLESAERALEESEREAQIFKRLHNQTLQRADEWNLDVASAEAVHIATTTSLRRLHSPLFDGGVFTADSDCDTPNPGVLLSDFTPPAIELQNGFSGNENTDSTLSGQKPKKMVNFAPLPMIHKPITVTRELSPVTELEALIQSVTAQLDAEENKSNLVT